ncbi:MAG: DMT family transporter [Saprospiraceae bacterium]|nr:DMT family transporter [Saprospiraceae bacterium]
MNLTDRQKAILNLHLAVFLFGFTGILGKLILLPALTLVWWRALMSWILMLPNLKQAGGLKNLTPRSIFIFLGIGVVVCFHWMCFYGSIKLSNSSIAMICLAFIPIFTAFFESLFNKRPLNRLDVITGLVTIPSMWMIVQNIDLSFRLGFAAGVLASLFSAIFASLNKKYIMKATAIQISWLELFSVWLVLSIIIPFMYFYQPEMKFLPTGMDFLYLILLSYVCTVVSYVLALKSLHHLSAFSSMLAFNLEPIYGIILAILVFSEHKEFNTYFYIGATILILSVFLHPILQKKWNPKQFPEIEQ